eukprot:PhM_4_TR13659/c0_g1_i2/m.72773
MFRSRLVRCPRAIAVLLESIPPNGAVTLPNLSRALPDDILEKVAEEHGSLKDFLRSFPHLFLVRPVGVKQMLTVSRPDFEGVVEIQSSAETKKTQKKLEPTDVATSIPNDVVDRMQAALKGKPKTGVSALYGSLKSSDRQVLRKYGGVLTVLKAFPDVFVVSRLGMLAALKSEQAVVLDDTELEVNDNDDEEVAVPSKEKKKALTTIEDSLPKMTIMDMSLTDEQVQAHAMYLVKYLPLHWTTEPQILNSVPEDVKFKHMSAGPRRILQRLLDFLDVKSGVGCKHRIFRLKRGVEIPDVGVIRSDGVMESLGIAQLIYATYITRFGSGVVPVQRVVSYLPKDPKLKIPAIEDLVPLLEKHVGHVVRVTPESSGSIAVAKFRDTTALPLLFEALKLTVPKHYIPVRAVEDLISPQALATGAPQGFVQWLRDNKEIFDITIPFVRKVRGVPTQPSELCVRRRLTSYVEITEDHVSDELRRRCPRDRTHVALPDVLATMPADVVDAMPSRGIVRYVARVGHPRVKVDAAPDGSVWLCRGAARDDGSQAAYEIGTFDPACESESLPSSEAEPCETPLSSDDDSAAANNNNNKKDGAVSETKVKAGSELDVDDDDEDEVDDDELTGDVEPDKLDDDGGPLPAIDEEKCP